MVVGYGLAALLFRAFWPEFRLSPGVGLPIIGLYAWLGLAMSGPIILMRHSTPPTAAAGPGKPLPDQETARTWAERAWLFIGLYWIVLGVLVIPFRSREFRIGDMVFFGLVPLAAALGLFFGRRPAPRASPISRWTHRLGIVLLATWPVAWVCLIVLGKNLR